MFTNSSRILALLTIHFGFTVAGIADDQEPLPIINREVLVGVYRDVGSGPSTDDLVQVLREIEGVYVRELTAEDIRSDGLSDLELIIHPGGSGGKQGRHLGEAGREEIRQFVDTGGGFIGICAGAYLASADYSWSLNLLDAKVLDRQHWARGMGMVEISLTDDGQSILNSPHDEAEIFYGQGPLLAPANHPEIPDYETIATYKTEIAKKGAPKGVMPGTTAIAHGRYGAGKVLCFSPHPEKTDNLKSYIHHAVNFVRKNSTRKDQSFPERDLEVVSLTPDVSQKGLANSNYCAPCSVTNLLYQFENRSLLNLPEEFDVRKPADDAANESRRSLATLLGDEKHMNALGRNGTNRYRLVNGFDRFLREQCESTLTVAYLGIRSYDINQLNEVTRSQTTATIGIPQLDQLKKELANDHGVIILFGSYKPNAKQSERLERIGGHYVSVVGYGEDEHGQLDSSTIILHDSNDSHDGNKYVSARPVTEPTELWSDGELLTKSSRLVELQNAPIRKDGRIAFLETIFSFHVSSSLIPETESVDSTP